MRSVSARSVPTLKSRLAMVDLRSLAFSKKVQVAGEYMMDTERNVFRKLDAQFFTAAINVRNLLPFRFGKFGRLAL